MPGRTRLPSRYAAANPGSTRVPCPYRFWKG
jgi:hypothetical protein